ncbi:MAG: hypothetical protein HQ553_06900 [Chloroflexi bacterium]|nr:hypothetical protein [Chloroflexota bacterium]
MELADEFLAELNKIENDPNLTRDQLKHEIDAKVRDLVERYRTEHLRKSASK